MPRKLLTMIFAVLIILSLGMTACAPAPEPVAELSGTTVQFWHVYGEGDPRNETILALVEEFNASNEYGITVEALDQGRYDDLEDKVNAGIQSGDIPQIAQAYTSALANWDLVDLIVELDQFVTDETYGLTDDEIADIYPGVFSTGVTLAGDRLGWAFSQSANLMVYNYTWAKELGFDAPPINTEELKAQVCAAAEANATDDSDDNDGTGGLVWRSTTSDFLSFLYAFGGVELNADGTAYDFNTPEAKAVALFINDLRDNGCVVVTESYPNVEQATRRALVTFSSNSGLKYYVENFVAAENDDEWGFLAFLGPDGEQSADAYTQTFGILKSTPEQELASWIFIKYLTAPANQATWVEASGYLPTQYSTEAMLTDYVASIPQYQSALVLAALGHSEPETFPAWYSVRRAIEDSAALLFSATTAEEVDAILADLNVTAAELVAEIE